MTQIQSSVTTEHDFTKSEGHCETRPTRLSIAGVLIATLRKHFSDPKFLLHSQHLGNKLWKEDPTTTGIRIESDLRYTPDKTDLKPSVIVSRGPIRRDSRGIADRLMGGNPYNAEDNYMTFWEVQHSILCTARATAEVEILTEEVSAALTHFQEPIRQTARALRFRAMGVSEVKRIKNVSDRWGCKISTQTYYDDSWTLTPFSTDVLEGFDLEVVVEPWVQFEVEGLDTHVIQLPYSPPEP